MASGKMKTSTWVWTIIIALLNLAMLAYLILKTKGDSSEDAQILFWTYYAGILAFDFLIWLAFKSTRLRKPIIGIIIFMLIILFPLMFELFMH
jgi:FtsH-binding integral membrane protein